jgi:hypothetical protein
LLFELLATKTPRVSIALRNAAHFGGCLQKAAPRRIIIEQRTRLGERGHV